MAGAKAPMQARAGEVIEVLHGVNLNMLGLRDPGLYGTQTLAELERQIDGYAAALGLRARHFQTNFEGVMVERLQGLRDPSGEPCAGIVINAGAWSHYAWAIRDALEIAALPAVEVHLSDIKAREPWRRLSVVEDVCIASFAGHGPEGYRLALERLRAELDRHAGAAAGGDAPPGPATARPAGGGGTAERGS
jgi:3-dehydroquinate dehydratase-2